MKNTSRRRPGRGAWVGIALAAGLAACGGSSEASDAAGRPGRGNGTPGDRVIPVATATVEVGTIARSITVSGVVEPLRAVGINSQLSGAVLEVRVEEGDVVRAGAVLARLDDREVRAQLASAEAAFEVADAAFQRSERLFERQVITRAEYDRDRAAYAAARAQLEQLRTRLDYTTVQAPISGVITEKHVEAGDIVSNQTRLFALADVDTLVVRVPVSELDVVELETGAGVDLTLDAYPDRQFEGRIRRIFPAADPTTRLVPVEVALGPNATEFARPGFLARVRFALNARHGARLVPASAIIGDASAPAVFVVRNGTALRRTVETGLTSEGRVEIVDGLEPGEVVVVAGNHTLRDGAQVREVQRAELDPAEAASTAAAANEGEGDR
ncbi:MAG TPA: efflux RND transporter periplasmic adaptor subunit [Longimicrobiales bacterium]